MDVFTPASQTHTSPRPVSTARSAWRRIVGHRLQEAGWALFFVAVFTSGYAQALSIHDFRVTSRLGEPLDATIVVEALPGEQLSASCVTTSKETGGALPAITGIRLSLTRSLTPGTIRLRTSQAVREPMSQIVLTVDCPGTPNISRTFMVMLDPPAADEPSAPVTAQTSRPTALNRPSPVVTSVARFAPGAGTAAPSTRAARPAPGSRSRIHRAVIDAGDPIPPGSQYTVRNGDSLSVIAARVQGRPSNSVWPIARAIHTANPGAFLLGDPNVITSGALLYIPTLEQSLGADAATAAPVRQAQSAATSSVPSAAAPAIADDGEPFVASLTATRNSLTIPVTPTPDRNDLPTAAAVAMAASARSRTLVKPLETMALTASLSALSINRLHLRRTGVLEVAPTAAAPVSAAATTNDPPAPQSGQDAPAATVAVTRPVIPAATGGGGIRLGWSMLAVLLALLGATVLAAQHWMRRQLRVAYVRDLREALRRRRYAERLRESREGFEQDDDNILVHESESESDTPAQAGAGDESVHSPTVIMPAAIIDVGDPDATPDDPQPAGGDGDPLDLMFPELGPVGQSPDNGNDTVETRQLSDDTPLDLELPPAAESPALISDETLQLSLGDDRTAELAAPDTEYELDNSAELLVDAELLALDYSQQFEASLQQKSDDSAGDNPTDEWAAMASDDDGDGDADLMPAGLMLEIPTEPPAKEVDNSGDADSEDKPEVSERDPSAFYHLQIDDESDAEPLSFESDDDEDGSKVVAFRGRD